jgi:hypothetical protein
MWDLSLKRRWGFRGDLAPLDCNHNDDGLPAVADFGFSRAAVAYCRLVEKGSMMDRPAVGYMPQGPVDLSMPVNSRQ